MWTGPSSQGILQCSDQISCVHMSGLLVRSHMNAGHDGFRDKGSKQHCGLVRAIGSIGVSCVVDRPTRCGRPHLALLRCLPGGHWFDEQAATWRDRRGRPARWPDLVEATRFRITRVVLAAAHLDSYPTNNRPRNLRALCQRCHVLHDRPHHLVQRWITYRRRLAFGDHFLGPYPALIAALISKRPAARLRNA